MMVDLEELKISLRMYKSCLGDGKFKVKEEKRVPVEVGQVRVLFWIPEEYVLVYHVEEEGLVHAVPLTIWTDLTTTSLRIRLRSSLDNSPKTLAPLPFDVYLRREVLEEESLPIYIVRKDTVEKVLRAVERAPVRTAIKPSWEFVKLVWKRYGELTLGSILATHIQREQQAEEEEQKAIIVYYPAFLYQKHYRTLQAYQRAASTNALRGKDWLGVVEEGKAVIYLPEEYEGRKVRIKLFDSVLYEGEGASKLIIENLPSELKSHEYLEEHLNVEILGD
ncbi:hypothetical protein [Thermocrinis sp.]|uniref:hypothetical protein n=1 Tax=Thermocrinis sp. TaxID=2024383 RepID=UPI002FDDB0C4